MSDKNIKDKVKQAYDLAFDYERRYGVCPQCLIAAIDDLFDLQVNDVFKAGYALAGGLGLTGNCTCGALAGGVLILGYKYGRERKDFSTGTRLKAFALAKKLHDRFVAEFGSCRCNDVQRKIFGRSFNLWDEDEYRKFEEAGGHTDKCPDVVGKVAMWVAEQLISEP